MVAQRGQPLGQNPAYRPSDTFVSVRGAVNALRAVGCIPTLECTMVKAILNVFLTWNAFKPCSARLEAAGDVFLRKTGRKPLPRQSLR